MTTRGLRVEVAGETTSVTLPGRGGAGDRPVTVSLTYHPAYDSPTGRQLPGVGLSIFVEGWKQPFEVALFPFQDLAGEYRGHTFFESLEKVGIGGALPFLPSRQEHVASFLRELLSQSGWSLADRVLDHRIGMGRARWMAETSQAALVVGLRRGENELEWIKKNRLYYVPLARLGKRKFSARWIAFSQEVSGPGGQAGAVTHEAEVLAADVKRRGEIETLWAPAHPKDLCVVYTLAEVQERPRPIPLERGMPRYRWASRLSLRRAREGSQRYL